MIPVWQYSGEFAALLAAFLWAASSVLFADLGKTIRPIELNLIKGVGAIFLLVLTSFILHEAIANISIMVIGMLFLSGAIGIGFGDTMYFEAINSIGARLTLLITTLAPLITAILAVLFLNENIVPYAWFGVVLTILGIAWVVTRKVESNAEQRKINQKGIVFASLFAVAQAAGAIISRWALTQTSISPLQSAVIRMFAGIVFLLTWSVIRHIKLGEWTKKPIASANLWGKIALVVIMGAYIPLWLQQVAFKNTEVGIAQTLLATSPLFILSIAVFKKEKISLREILGVIVSIAGIGILFLAH